MSKLTTVQNLISEMSLAEKIGQLNLLNGTTKSYAAAIRSGSVGGFLIGNRPNQGAWSSVLNDLQRIAVKELRLGTPLVFSRDVIHGYRTIFPIPLGLAATFHPPFGGEMGKVSADECQRDGVRWTFTPR